jgi:hypothetical protein
VLLVLYIEQRAQHPRASTFFDVMIVGLHSRIKVIIVRSVRILVFSRIDVKIRQSCMVLRETAGDSWGPPVGANPPGTNVFDRRPIAALPGH